MNSTVTLTLVATETVSEHERTRRHCAYCGFRCYSGTTCPAHRDLVALDRRQHAPADQWAPLKRRAA